MQKKLSVFNIKYCIGVLDIFEAQHLFTENIKLKILLLMFLLSLSDPCVMIIKPPLNFSSIT